MYRFKSCNKTLINDNAIPGSGYLKLRTLFLFTGALLLESASFHAQQNHFSIICLEVVAEIILNNYNISYRYPDKCEEKISLTDKKKYICEDLENFMKKFYSENKLLYFSGFYGYFAYHSFPYFENINLPCKSTSGTSNKASQIPKIRLALFRTLILFNHFNNVLYIFSHIFSNNEKSYILRIINILLNKKIIHLPFITKKVLASNITEIQYKKSVCKSIRACKRGASFQIVPSRQFQQKFKGDEFNVYRILRSINPSPNLFYFDYGDYNVFGSSPEYQFTIKNNTAYIFPIAGTILRLRSRSLDDLKYKILAEELSKNTKENAEHIMLVDMSRNDLSRNSSYIKVERYKEIQYFSHVFHIESIVTGKLTSHYSPVKVFASTFPTGTLSGSPKYKAIELIDEFEYQSRGVYGGSIGFFGVDGQLNTSIIIRAFLSKGNTLFIRAGSGVVADSTEVAELQEVNNKLIALNKSIRAAEKYFI